MSDAAGRFYASPSADQVEAQRQLVLGALREWDLGEIRAVTLLAERENAVFDVQAGQRRVVARVHRAGYHTDAQLASQQQWMAALADEGVVRTAPWVPARDGRAFVVARHPSVPEPRQVSVLEFVEGEQLSSRLGSAGTDEVARWFCEVGALAAAVHDHGSQWHRGEGFACARWDATGLVGDDPVWGRFWGLDDLAPGDAARMVAFRDRALGELDAFGEGAAVFGLVHNDLLPENLLVADGGLCLLDFDDFGDGWYLFDLCTALVSVATRDDYPEVKEAFLGGYRERRALPCTDAQLGLFFALRMATYAGWIATRRHTNFARELGPVITAAAVDVVGRFLDGELEV